MLSQHFPNFQIGKNSLQGRGRGNMTGGNVIWYKPYGEKIVCVKLSNSRENV